MAKQKVFLVDDDSDILVLNRDFLESEGYDVVTAASCAEALEKIKLHSFSCIVLDVMLPDGSAFDLAPKIKEYTDCPIIFLTAKDQQEDVINGFKVGADDYITKPYSLPELSLRINVHIKRNMKSEGFLVDMGVGVKQTLRRAVRHCDRGRHKARPVIDHVDLIVIRKLLRSDDDGAFSIFVLADAVADGVLYKRLQRQRRKFKFCTA